MRELTKVAQRGPDLRFERRHLAVVPGRAAGRALARDREVDREGQQTLLRSVVEIAFEPPTLGLRSRDDLGARVPQFEQAGLALGVQALVLESQARRVNSAGDSFAILGQVGPIDQNRDRGATAANVDRGSGRISRRRLRDAGRIDEPPVIEREEDLEGRVTQLPAERRRQIAGRRGGRQLEGKARHPLSGLAPSHPTGGLANGDRHKCEGRHRPQHEVDRIVREQAARDRVHAMEAGRSQRDGRRRPHRCRAATLAGGRAHEPSDDQREGSEDPDRLEPETKARRTGDEPRVAREREQVVRAKRASGRDGIEGQGRHEPEDTEVGDVGPGHDQPTGPTGPDRNCPPRGTACASRAGHAFAKSRPTVKTIAGADAGFAHSLKNQANPAPNSASSAVARPRATPSPRRRASGTTRPHTATPT